MSRAAYGVHIPVHSATYRQVAGTNVWLACLYEGARCVREVRCQDRTEALTTCRQWAPRHAIAVAS